MAAAELPELLVADAAQWRAWLADHHADSAGVWLVLHKKGGQVTELDYDHALEEALCVGWIDGQVSRRDSGSFRQRFTPRRPKSPWSARNVGIVSRLIAEGRMLPTGHAAIEAAKADGRWDVAYAGPATAEPSEEFAAAIAANPRAQAMWQVLTSANKYALIWRIGQAKRAETKAKRIAEYVEMLADGRTVHPQRAAAPWLADD